MSLEERFGLQENTKRDTGHGGQFVVHVTTKNASSHSTSYTFVVNGMFTTIIYTYFLILIEIIDIV